MTIVNKTSAVGQSTVDVLTLPPQGAVIDNRATNAAELRRRLAVAGMLAIGAGNPLYTVGRTTTHSVKELTNGYTPQDLDNLAKAEEKRQRRADKRRKK